MMCLPVLLREKIEAWVVVDEVCWYVDISVIFFSSAVFMDKAVSLWLPCIADADIIFLPCGFFLLSIS